MLKKLLLLAFAAVSLLPASAKDDDFTLYGRVKDAVHKMDLKTAKVIVYNQDGTPRDTVDCNQGLTWRNGGIDTLSSFYASIPRTDTVAMLDVMCPGYKTENIIFDVTTVGKRERFRDLGTIFLDLAPVELKEVTVTSSKIKFYNKGDTVVFNADAFQLSHGAMLDQLISQLPGVELGDNGQIKVNGEFVEELLLNGKQFFDGDNNLMLQNISAFTVKDIQVYSAQSKEDKQRLDLSAPKKLTMDVTLKKEYLMGWLVNAQAGYGTENRYLGRAFVNWFNATTRVTLVGNLNNLNDNRTPGKNDTWTPEEMPSGVKLTQNIALNYNYEKADETVQADGQIRFRHSSDRLNTTMDRINFLPGGNTYDNSYTRGRFRSTQAYFNNSFYSRKGQVRSGIYLRGSYDRTKNTSTNLSGTFNEEQDGLTMEKLEALYSTDDRLDQIINRANNRADGWSETWSGAVSPFVGYKLPKSSDSFTLYMDASYNSTKSHDWNDYEVNYGADANPAVKRRQYRDNTPNHSFSFSSALQYSTQLWDNYAALSYRYTFDEEVKDSYMYALERLGDMGAYGVLPANYKDALDPANSYTSHTFRNTHSLAPYFGIYHDMGENNAYNLRLMPSLNFIHRHLNYWRNNRDFSLSRSYTNLTISSIWSGMVELYLGKYTDKGRSHYRNSLRYSYRIEPELPEMTDMLDIVDDSNPLNIYYGNPDLKKAVKHSHLLRWQYSPQSHSFNNYFYASFTHTSNSLLRGYTYDTATGIRHNRMYNVAGVRGGGITEELSWQFGKTKQFTLSSNSDLYISRMADMIGVDKSQPDLFKVNNLRLGEKLRLSYQLGQQSIGLRAEVTSRHTTSNQAGFNTIDAWHLNYGVNGNFRLPAGFGISTDFMCYSRHGYGSADLDTTDPVWNARISYAPPRNSHWVFMVDGFDLLHKLSNVNYAVTATGRTVSYTNTIPRYVLFSVQYRLSIQPKRH